MIKFEPERFTLGALMQTNGYTTACFGKWHQGINWKEASDGTLATTPVDFGFDTYFGYDAAEVGPYVFIDNKRLVSPLTRQIEEQLGTDVSAPKMQGAHWYPGPASEDWDFETCLPRIAAKADEWIEKHVANNPDRPFFIYYAIPAPHAPWVPAKEFVGKTGAGQYGDYVMTVDAMIGQLLDTLDRHGLTENTLVFFSSDNGPMWFPADAKRYGHKASGPWRGMKGDLFEAGHRMPFIARWPGRIKEASTCDQQICFTDMMATMAALLGDTLPEGAGEDSLNILPLLQGKNPSKPIRDRIVHSCYQNMTLAIRDGDWKLILPVSVYTIEDHTIVPGEVVETSGESPFVHF